MPSRLGETMYDWGDFTEPLVHQDDLYWSSIDFKIDFLFDSRVTNKTFRQSISELENLRDSFELINQFGSFNVKLKEANKTKHTIDSKVVYELIFTNENVQFNSELPSPIVGSGISIDGYGLYENFSLLIQSVKLNDNIASLKDSNKTVSNFKNLLSSFRTFKEIEIKSAIKNDGNEFENIEFLKKILSNSGLRKIAHKGINYNAFLTQGFKVIIKRNFIEFTFKLNILNQIGVFQDGLFEIGLLTSGNQRKFLN
jgi:hypothetical protein